MAQIPVGNTTGQPNDYDVDSNAGAATDATQRMILASNDPAVALLTAIDADTSNLAAILTAVDGVEALIGTTNSTLTTIDGRVDTVETLLARLLPRATTVVDVSLASDTTSAQLLAANANRIGLTLTNTDANAVYVYFGTTAVATKFTVKIPADGYYEMPQPIYTGRIDALWAGNGSGSLIGTELAA